MGRATGPSACVTRDRGFKPAPPVRTVDRPPNLNHEIP
ncbi:hypothetical protein RKD44_000651 [Streptomyces collinus]